MSVTILAGPSISGPFFPQLDGGLAYCFLEEGAEVGWVADAALLGYFPDWKVGAEEQFLGFGDAVTEDQVGGGASGDGLDFSVEMCAGNAHT